MRRECRERFPRHRLQMKPLVSDPDMHHGTCVTHVPWYMSGSLTRGGEGNVPGIPGACTTHNFTYMERGPCNIYLLLAQMSSNMAAGGEPNSHLALAWHCIKILLTIQYFGYELTKYCRLYYKNDEISTNILKNICCIYESIQPMIESRKGNKVYAAMLVGTVAH